MIDHIPPGRRPYNWFDCTCEEREKMASPSVEAASELSDSPGTSASTTPEGSGSPPEFRRITRGYKKRKSEITAFTGANKIQRVQFSGGGNRGANLDDITQLIANLKESIIETVKSEQQELRNQNNKLQEEVGSIKAQNSTLQREVHSIRTQNDDLQGEIRSIQTQNNDLQDEIRSVKTQLDTYSVSPPSTRTWASVAASGQTASTYNMARSTTTQKGDPTCVRITVPLDPPNTGSEDTLTRYLPTNAAFNRVQEALQKDDATHDAQLAGIGTTKAGYLVRFRDERSAEKARNTTEWLQNLGQETKISKPRFGVVVHRTPTAELPALDVKPANIAKITQENNLADKGIKIEDIAWLKKKDAPLGAHASLGVWFDSVEAAKRILREGMLFGHRHVGSIEPYEVKKKRCFKCQRPGHLAWNCKETARCAHCALEHDRRDCPPGSSPRCVDCNGGHPTGSRECRNVPDGSIGQ